MRSDAAPDWVFHTNHGVVTQLSSWRAGELLADNVPLAQGRLRSDNSSNVPSTALLYVPATEEWKIKGTASPLAPYGQRLSISQTITIAEEVWTVPLGWLLIQNAERVGEFIQIEALDLMQLVLDYRFESPRQPPSNATFFGETSALLAGLLPFRSEVTNRLIPRSISTEWVEDRIGALRDIARAWPADIRVDDTGVVVASPVRTVKSTPDIRWVHGQDSAFVRVETGSSRDDIYNQVIARGTTEDGEDVWASAVDNRSSSPTNFYGPWGRRNRFFFSPLITSKADAQATANTELAKEYRKTSLVYVIAPPDPRIELLDTAEVTLADGTVYKGLIEEIDFGLTASSGAASYTISMEGF